MGILLEELNQEGRNEPMKFLVKTGVHKSVFSQVHSGSCKGHQNRNTQCQPNLWLCAQIQVPFPGLFASKAQGNPFSLEIFARVFSTSYVHSWFLPLFPMVPITGHQSLIPHQLNMGLCAYQNKHLPFLLFMSCGYFSFKN